MSRKPNTKPLELKWDLLDVAARLERGDQSTQAVKFTGSALRLFNDGAAAKARRWILTLKIEAQLPTGELYRQTERFSPDQPLHLRELNRIATEFTRSNVMPELVAMDATLTAMRCRAVIHAL